ncbi:MULTISPECIES: hypothetical protein [Paenibacillus]|jgi:hypothetical protein|uniref:Uncharacterized protein n=1 Tax=Paenibacillus odorifer TaxID=189426 RepID=A0ABX3GXZ7_9BACL|nr:hypothetical protein [Paenibacillus odorifer]OMD37490.1 hypothetical protein BSO21_05725 [Paenibacillus odorifer]OMD85796.1 hypothetical protein BSK53_06720 [Paenibacillus odorifer]
MKKFIVISGVSLFLLAISFNPLFNYIREYIISDQINQRYEIKHAEKEYNPINVQEITVDDKNIKIREEKTGRKADLTPWDKEEKVPPGDIVKVQFLLNDQKISTPDEIWLSNRDRGSRYFSWIDILTVKDRKTGENQINIVQRLTDDSQPMETRKWKIITIAQDGEVDEEVLSYAQRSNNHLGVKLIEFSGTSLMGMGYYSDVTKAYPSIFFPLLFPFLTGIAGLLLLIFLVVLLLFELHLRRVIRKRGR